MNFPIKIVSALRFTFTPNGNREFVPRDQVFPLIVVHCLLLLLKNKAIEAGMFKNVVRAKARTSDNSRLTL